jgi:hypothetical protein
MKDERMMIQGGEKERRRFISYKKPNFGVPHR